MKRLVFIPTGNFKFQRPYYTPLPFPLLSISLCFSCVERSISVQTDALIQPPGFTNRYSLGDPLDEFISLLKNSARTFPVLSKVSSLHCVALKAGINESEQVGTGILNLYVKCSSMAGARKVFDEMRVRNTLTWTIMLSACVQNSENDLALSLFKGMLVDAVLPNCFTLATAFKCCAKSSTLAMGKSIHGWIFRNGIEMDVVLQNSIVDFYAKLGAFVYARTVFEMMTERDAASWNAMIGVHIRLGDMNGAMELFKLSPSKDASSWNAFISGQMHNGFDEPALQLLHLMAKIGPMFDRYTLSIVLVLAAKFARLDLGKQVHTKLFRLGFENDTFVKNSLINMYSKCGKIETASIIFGDKIRCTEISQSEQSLNTISWSTLIAGFVQRGSGDEALALFCRMLHEGGRADQFSLTSIVSACADIGILQQGRQIHACIEKSGHGFDDFLASALIDMYAKCGSLDDAQKIFDSRECMNIVFWTSMIASYALFGEGREAINVFRMMLEKKIMPNRISFTCLLSACSHEGLVVEGYEYFNSMRKDHGIVPTIEHFNCMVDLLGRRGLLDEAKNFIGEYNLWHHSIVWKSLLSACRLHGDIKTARWASQNLVEIEPHEAESYVLLSSMYATKREWAKASKQWDLMKDKGATKQPGRSWIQLKDKIHIFVAGDKSHPESELIYSYLESLVSDYSV